MKGLAFLKWVGLVTFLLIMSCKQKDDKKTISLLSDIPVVKEGVYQTQAVIQPSFRDYNAKEKVQSKLKLQGDQVVYEAYRDDKIVSVKKGTYDPRHKSFFLGKEGQPKPERHALTDITDTSFTMKMGRQGYHFKKTNKL